MLSKQSMSTLRRRWEGCTLNVFSERFTPVAYRLDVPHRSTVQLQEFSQPILSSVSILLVSISVLSYLIASLLFSLFRTGPHCAAQVGPKLLGSSHHPASVL